MTGLADHLDNLDSLVRTARTSGMAADKFVAAFRDAMQRVSGLLSGNPPDGFLDAASNLTQALLDYEMKPGLSGIGKIGNALVSYRRTATIAHH
jgi:hypothetical protein